MRLTKCVDKCLQSFEITHKLVCVLFVLACVLCHSRNHCGSSRKIASELARAQWHWRETACASALAQAISRTRAHLREIILIFVAAAKRAGAKRRQRDAQTPERYQRRTDTNTCTLAGGSLRRVTCREQLAQSILHRVTGTQLAQGNWHAAARGALARSNMRRAAFQEHFYRATCAEALAQSNLAIATCTERLRRAIFSNTSKAQLAQGSLRSILVWNNLHTLTCMERKQVA